MTDEYDYGNGDSDGLSIDEAQAYFEENITEFRWLSTVSPTRSSIDEEPIITPLWESGRIANAGNKKVIDVPLDAPITIVTKLMTPKDTLLSNRRRYRYNTAFRMLAERNELGEYSFIIAAITCDAEYLKRRSKRHHKRFEMKYSDLSSGFDGEVRYFNLVGEFLYGYAYTDGRRTSVISRSIDDDSPSGFSAVRFNNPSTRAIQSYCWDEVVAYDYYFCTEVSVGGEVIGEPNCEYQNTYYVTETYCRYYDDGSGDGNAGNTGDNNGGTSFTPPTYWNIDRVSNDPIVKDGIEELWEATKSSANETDGRREVGCWVYWNDENTKYVLGPMEYGPYVKGENTHGSIDPSTPNRSYGEAITYIHCHTPLTYELSDCYRPVGPSEPDKNYINQPGKGLIVVDYIGALPTDADKRNFEDLSDSVYIIKGGHNIDDPKHLYIIRK